MYKQLRTQDIKTRSTKKPHLSKPKRFIAVWLDHKTAHILSVENSSINRITIPSNFPKRRKSTGGTHANRPYAEYSLASEHNEHRWREEIKKKYFQNIIELIDNAIRIVLLGPGSTKDELLHEIQKHSQLGTKLDSETITLEKLSPSQLDRFVIDYFNASNNL